MNYFIIIIFLVITVLLLITKNKTVAIPFLLYLISINFTKILKYDFDVYFKLLFLMAYLFYAFKLGINKRYVINNAIITLILIVNFFFARFDSDYSYMSWLTASIPLLMGVFVFTICFRDIHKVYILKALVYVPIFSIIFGFCLWPLKIVNPLARGNYIGLSGVSEATNLAFFCLISMMACLLVFRKTKNVKYRYLFYLEYLFLIATLTRGGILAGTVIVLYDIFPFLKSSIKNRKRFAILSFSIIASTYPLMLVINQLFARMYDSSGAINTSGRIEAWTYIISLCKNNLVGNGYGFLKTRTEYQLTFFTAAHNEYVHLYTEIGYIGLIIFFFTIINVFYAYSGKTAHPFQKNGAPFRLKLSNAQLVN